VCGYGFGIVTNCFWARDEQKTQTMLKPLVELGLGQLFVSLDDFHQEFVDPRNVKNCVHAAISLGIHVEVLTIKTRSGRGKEYYQKHLDLPSDPVLVQWTENPCQPGGRALTDVPPSEFVLEWRNRPGQCMALRVWNIDPYGWVVPCPGTAFAPLMRVGNAFETPLPDLVNRANVDPLLNTLAAWGGPYQLIRLLEARGYHDYSTRLFASQCHACATVLQDQRTVELIKKELPNHWLDALAARLVAQRLWWESLFLKDHRVNWLPAGWVEPSAAQADRQEAPVEAGAPP
jgi:hypothetical protein